MNRLIFVLFALVVTMPAVFKSRSGVSSATLPAFLVSSSGRKVIRVDGDVRHPGIYVVSANLLAGSVIALAEPVRSLANGASAGAGKRSLANGDAVNLSGNTLKKNVITVGSVPAAQRMILGIPLDIQSMDAGDFERLPSIGPVLAHRIVNYRQNNGGNLRPVDLLLVEGIGEKKYNVLKKFFN
ncbi:MAG: helix-hairpin-helix domain-containing protein [Desulfuromonadales bacterium]|nr:helix-hairpin-helix domain-containing protein [Desulfuromonadales bacterium]